MHRLSIAPLALCATVVAAGAVQAPYHVERWAPTAISSPQFESHGAFDPTTGDFYFVRSSPAFEGWRILRSHCAAPGWSAPVPASFTGDGVEADPWFTPDGRQLFFISTRSTDGIKRKDLDIWRVYRADDGTWQTPQRLPTPINSTGNEWFPRVGKDGWLYFGSDRVGGSGKTDIWRARAGREGAWRVENVGPSINTAADEYEPLPAPDGTYMIVMAGDGLYESKHEGDSWSPRRKLPAPINVDGSEIGAAFSPSGRSLLFSRDTKGMRSGEFFVWHIDGDEHWPPACPSRK